MKTSSKTMLSQALALAGFGALSFSTAPAATSFFDTGAEGWLGRSFSNLAADNYFVMSNFNTTFSASGGNPGGFISISDPDNGDFTFSAPAAFLGNLSTAIGTTMTYDLMHTGPAEYHTSDVIFTGNGSRLLWRSSPDLTPSTAWTSVAVLLSPSAQWHLNTTSGALATATDFQNVFANVDGIFIRGEFSTSQIESSGLDNVLIVPEPGSGVLLFAGLGSLLLFRWRRERETRVTGSSR